MGAWNATTRTYRPYDAASDSWMAPAPLPWEHRRIEQVDLEKDPGVIRNDKGTFPESCPRATGYVINGRPCTGQEAFQALEKFGLPDDASLLRLTVIGTDADRKQVEADLLLSPLRDMALLVQSYRPDDWALRPGFFTGGAPTIYLQAPDGKVLHRQDSYQGSARLVEAIRKARGGYDAKKDPDLSKPGWMPSMAWLWLAGPVLLVLLLPKARPA